jgi:hypothetical protein
VSAQARDATSTFRHATPGCVVCGAEFRRAAAGRRRLYCAPACRQRAYRLRDEARRRREAVTPAADPAEVSRLLVAVLRTASRR